MKKEDDQSTHFGFQSVGWKDKTAKVAGVFHSVASKYDLMNDVMSLGIHRLWKRRAIDQTGIRPGQRALDLAGGTGDLTKLLLKKVGLQGHVTLSDINPSMLEAGRKRLTDEGIVGNVDYIEANAEDLAPFHDEQFDCVTMAFGLRNVTDKDAALRSIYRVLKPGGCIVILEFSKIENEFLRKIYDTYSFKLIPKLGELITRDKDSYQYLVESIRMHPDQASLKKMMEAAGFQSVRYDNLTRGVVAIHQGFKPHVENTATTQS